MIAEVKHLIEEKKGFKQLKDALYRQRGYLLKHTRGPREEREALIQLIINSGNTLPENMRKYYYDESGELLSYLRFAIQRPNETSREQETRFARGDRLIKDFWEFLDALERWDQ